MSGANDKNPKLPESDIERIIGRACDDLLSEDDTRVLAEALRRSEEDRSAYLRAMGLECLLTREHDDNPVDRALLDESLAGKTRGHADGTLLGFPAVEVWPSRPQGLYRMTAVAAALFVMTGAAQLYEASLGSAQAVVSLEPTAARGLHVGTVSAVHPVRWALGAGVDSPGELVGGQNLRLLEGVARIELDLGLVVTLEGPAELEVVSSNTLRARRGRLRATGGAAAEGFVIQTPSAHVVQVGPDLGSPDEPAEAQPDASWVRLDVHDDGVTDVVVFDGEVALQYAKETTLRRPTTQVRDLTYRVLRSERRLSAGEALSVSRDGGLRRIVSVVDGQEVASLDVLDVAPLIRSVSDDFRDPAADWFYQIVPGGFAEDARAFVDRFHQWNGIGADGLPEFLRNGDYVRTFNSDKWNDDLAITVEVERPARLYVLCDDRVAPPRWIRDRFIDTGYDVGLDEGWRDRLGRRHTLSRSNRLTVVDMNDDEHRASPDLTDAGPGSSIDAVYSVWRLEEPVEDRVTLGPPGYGNERTGMYGIVAVEL